MYYSTIVAPTLSIISYLCIEFFGGDVSRSG